MENYLNVSKSNGIHFLFIRWDEFFSRISFTLWRFREDARVDVCAASTIFTTGLTEYARNVNNSDFDEIFCVRFCFDYL